MMNKKLLMKNLNFSEEEVNKKKGIGLKKRKEESVCFVMVDESIKDNGLFFNLEYKDKTSNMNSFVSFQISSEVFEMINCDCVRSSNLIDFLLDSFEQGDIFFLEFEENFFDLRNIDFHAYSHHLLNSSKVIGFISPDFSLREVSSTDATTSLAMDSFTSLLSSLGMPEISSMKDNFKFSINCLTTLSKANLNSSLNSEGTLTSRVIFSINRNNGEGYLKLSYYFVFLIKEKGHVETDLGFRSFKRLARGVKGKKRGFSISNHLIKSVSKYVKLTKDDFSEVANDK